MARIHSQTVKEKESTRSVRCSQLSAADPLLTARRAAEKTGLPLRTLRHLYDTRVIPLTRVEGRLFVRESDLQAYLEAGAIPARRAQ